MKLQKHIKEIVITLTVISITAGAYATLSTVNTGDGLTATLWNNMVVDVNSNTDKLTNISSNGANVGIGTASPSGKLHVKSSSINPLDPITYFVGVNNKYLSYFQDLGAGSYATSVSSGDQALIFSNDGLAATSTNGLFIGAHSTAGGGIKIMENGNVGIGHANPSQLLHVNGTALAAAWNTSSDIRKKEDINLIVNPLEKIEKLRGVTFKWKDTKKDDTGVIAQEVEKEFPEFVTTGTDGYKSVDYGKLVAPLIESVKELKKENDEKDDDIEELKESIKVLQLEVNNLKSK